MDKRTIEHKSFFSPELGFKQELLFSRGSIPARGMTLGYELGINHGVAFSREGKEEVHITGLHLRFKDLYTLKSPAETVDLKTWGMNLFYNFDGKVSVGLGPGYSWSRNLKNQMNATEGFHLNADLRLNPLFLANKVSPITLEIQCLDLSVYFADGSVGLGAGIFLKGWCPL